MPVPLFIFLMCVSAVLCLNAVLTVGAVLPALIADWGLSNAEGGWLNGIFFAGFIVAVPVLSSLTDRLDVKRIYGVSVLLTIIGAGGFGLAAEGFWSGMGFRFLSGAGLAGTYSTGLKALADCYEGPTQGRAVSFYSSCYSIGTAFSIFLGGTMENWLGWRSAFFAAAASGAAAFLIVWMILPSRSPDRATRPTEHLLDFRPVIRNKRVMTYVLVFLGHTWEMFGNRMWLVAFFTYVFALHPEEAGWMKPSDIAALVALVAVPLSMVIGFYASKRRREPILLTITIAAFVIGCAAGFSAPLAVWIVIGVGMLYSIAAFADSGTISSGMMSVADPNRRGSTVAIQSSVGYCGGLLAPVMVGVTLDLVGGYDLWLAWGLAFVVMALGSGFAAVALMMRADYHRVP